MPQADRVRAGISPLDRLSDFQAARDRERRRRSGRLPSDCDGLSPRGRCVWGRCACGRCCCLFDCGRCAWGGRPDRGLFGVTGRLSWITALTGSGCLSRRSTARSLSRSLTEQHRVTGDAVGAGARRAADAVDVALRLVRQLVIDHMGDAVDIDAAGGDVSGDQDPGAARLELVQGPLAGVLPTCYRGSPGRRSRPSPGCGRPCRRRAWCG